MGIKRYAQMDGLRAAAAMAVVMIHVTAGAQGRIALSINQLARFSVPLFLMLSGFGHAAGARADEDWLTVCRRRLWRVLPAYLVWSALYLLVDAAFRRPHAHPLRDLLTGNAYMHLYYVFVLLQFVLISLLLQRAVKRFPVASLCGAGAVSLVLQSVLCLQALGSIRLPAFPVPMVLWFAPWLIFYVGGLWLGRRPAQSTIGRGSVVAIIALWGVSAALVLLTAKRFPALRSLSLRPDLTLYVFASWLLLWMLFGLVRKTPRPIYMVSRLSFGLYLSHPLVLRLWSEWAARQRPVIYLRMWQSYLMAVFGGLLTAFMLSWLPFGYLLGGARKSILTEEQNGEKNRD
nr:acyltransferase [uncultured Agathobaculum sp.]